MLNTSSIINIIVGAAVNNTHEKQRWNYFKPIMHKWLFKLFAADVLFLGERSPFANQLVTKTAEKRPE